ncbi:CheR family methyltransferase [Geopsychrobacter electrodiphilus]|uniref:CheR family methyltransferase n=1 Tax=Geopsychrobacter electrodiphilus TaxID=225196 RepID=UPI000381A194|nr:protein-glutamate O-methyltransferase CheR [Geopsychrobacter electrodiphilus]
MFVFSPDIILEREEFQLLRDFIYQHCGLHFADESKYLLEKRLNKRLSELHLSCFREYYYQLRYGQNRDQELAAAIDLLTTNETYFFREDFQLQTFTNEVIPELVKTKLMRRERSIRIWSAGCSSGEEPYTLAMLLLENPLLQGWSIEIIGTDISQRVLKTAREGLYGQNSFRATDENILKRFFTPVGQKWQIDSRVKDLVSISHLNFFDNHRVALLGMMDVVFCRNVIIYFDLDAKKRAISILHNRLRPGGYLLLGHSESLMNVSSDFCLRHFTNDMLYQRPDSAKNAERGS